MNLVEKYRPETLDDVCGHNSNIKKIRKWAENWSDGDKPLLFHGTAGTGKTSAAESLANEMDWSYNETNASESRSAEDMEFLAQEIRSYGDDKILFVLDEVDSIDGRSLQTLYKVIDDSPNPIICTANEKWKVPDGLVSRCKEMKFNLRKDSMKKFLRNVASEEDIDISSRELGQLSTRNGLRDALNDLQEYSKSGRTDWDARDTEDSPFAVTRRILLNKDYIGDMTPDDMVSFLNENIKSEFEGVETLRSYQAISEADKWLGKVNRTQNYSWWAYAGPIAEEVSNLRLTEPYNDWVNVNYPQSRRNYNKGSQAKSPEATLYRELKNNEYTTFSFDFNEFIDLVLPEIKNSSDEEKCKFASSYSLSDDAVKAINVTKSDIEEWRFEEVDEDSNDLEEDSGENMSIFDF